MKQYTILQFLYILAMMVADESDCEYEKFIEEEKALTKSFVSTGFANSDSILAFEAVPTAQFLARTEHLSIRGATVSETLPSLCFKMETDYDGCVIQLKSIKGILLPADHLSLMPFELQSIRPVCALLKKHIDLCSYSRSQLKQFGYSLGTQILYCCGWAVWLAVIPDPLQVTPVYTEEVVRKGTYKLFLSLRQLFGRELKLHVGTEKVRNSLMKTALTNLSKVRLLPDERGPLYAMFQRAVNEVDVLNGQKLICFAYRFGERSSQPFDFSYFPSETVDSISIHIACNVSGKDELNLLWSRVGLQEVTGTRGFMSPCLSFFEVCNWQSNLDGRTMDISRSLRNLCSDGVLRFIQLYGDTPHRCYEGRANPVSGSIACGGLLPGGMLTALTKDAEKYISIFRENTDLLRDLRCRVEIVAWFDSLPESQEEIFDRNILQELLSKHAMVVPFYDYNGKVMNWLRNTIASLTTALNGLYQKKRCTGEFEATWKAFQLELALEKIFWGRPLSWQASQLSINLGPGVAHPSRSITDELGFMALAEPNTVALDESSTPPLGLWTRNPLLTSRIRRLFGFCDYLKSSAMVVGRRLILLLLGDLLEKGSVGTEGVKVSELLTVLKGSGDGRPISRTLTILALARLLAAPRGAQTCFRRAVALLQVSGRTDIEIIIAAGCTDMGLKIFPTVQLYDQSRNQAFFWNGRTYFRLVEEQKEDDPNMPFDITCSIIVELEKKRSIFMSKLRFPGDPFVFPWVQPILRRLSETRLSKARIISVLTFLSAVALKQQGWYVPYESLKELEEASPVGQMALKSMEILSKFILCKVGRKNIWRIHPEIPVKLDTLEKSKPATSPIGKYTSQMPSLPQASSGRENDASTQEKETFELQNVLKVQTRHVPDRFYQRWQAEEIQLLHEVKSMNNLDTVLRKYEKYKELCFTMSLPDRSFIAFKKKLQKVEV